MNIRFSKNSIRFRITKDELSALLKQKFFKEETPLPSDQTFGYEVLCSKSDRAVSLNFSNYFLTLFVPEQQVEELAARLPSKEGLYSEINIGTGLEVHI